MIAVIDENYEVIASLCRKYGVTRLEIFGSAVDDARFDSVRSDIDFLVEFDYGGGLNPSDQYFDLLAGLESLFGKRVDLVCAKAMSNPYFIQSVNATRRVLYAA